MSVLVIVPRYGRDYTSPAQALAAWQAGHDFTIVGLSRWANMAVNRVDAESIGPREGFSKVRIRFNKQADFVEAAL